MKNPEYNAVKVIALVAVIGIAGAFIYSNMSSRPDQTGQVIPRGNAVVIPGPGLKFPPLGKPVTPSTIITANGKVGSANVSPASPTIAWSSSAGAVACQIGPSNTSNALWSAALTANGTASSVPGTMLTGTSGSFVGPAPVAAPATYAVRCNDSKGVFGPESKVTVY